MATRPVFFLQTCREDTATQMRNMTWHVHVHRPITVHDEASNPVTVERGEYPMRDADLISYEIGERGKPMGRLRLTEILKLRRAGALTIDGAFP